MNGARLTMVLICACFLVACDDDPTDPVAPVSVTQLSPADGTGVARDPVLQWQADDPDGFIAEYVVLLDEQDPPTTEVASVTITTAQITDLEPWRHYHWQVRALDAQGAEVARSATASFLTGLDLLVAHPLPGQDEVRLPCRFAWVANKASGQGVTSYELRLGDAADALETVYEGPAPNCWSLELEPLRTYHWSVTARDDDGLEFTAGPWSFQTSGLLPGLPELTLAVGIAGQTIPFALQDTVGFGHPFTLLWEGRSDAAEHNSAAELAEVDQVGAPDGLLGFQWAMPPMEFPMVWHPRYFDETLGDSVSYFADVSSLHFANDGSGEDILRRELDAGVISIVLKTQDIASAEPPEIPVQIVVNHDPDTQLLNGELDPVGAHGDPQTYPYYVVRHGPEAGVYSFSEGDTVPDGAYVVFKALGWDDQRDLVESVDNEVIFQGRYDALGMKHGTIPFSFSSTFSTPHQTAAWTAPLAHDISADTLGFAAGPFLYDVVMRAVDEQGTRDGTPAELSFQGNFAPCVQCVELGGLGLEPAATYADIAADNCWDGSCLDAETEVALYLDSDPRYQMLAADQLTWQESSQIFVHPGARLISQDLPSESGWVGVPTSRYVMLIYLHGKDHPREPWTPPFARDRIKSWRYQVDYEADPHNLLEDGPGHDHISQMIPFDVNENVPDPLVSDVFIDEAGVWGMQVQVDVPMWLLLGGEEAYWQSLLSSSLCPPYPEGGTDAEILAWQVEPTVFQARATWDLTRMQLTPGTLQVVARDQAYCHQNPSVSGYHVYDGTRIPRHGRDCEPHCYDQPGFLELARIELGDYAAESDDGEPVRKPFRINAYQMGSDTPLDGSTPPPGWIGY